jgi:hypothetical protein
MKIGRVVLLAAMVAGCTSNNGADQTGRTPPSTPPSQSMGASGQTNAPHPRCGRDDVAIALGRSGIWHGLAQNVDVRNISQQRCVVDGSSMQSVTIVLQDGRRLPVDLSPLSRLEVTLAPGRRASLLIGTNGTCPSMPSARVVTVRWEGAEHPDILHGARAPACDAVQANDLYNNPLTAKRSAQRI